MKNNNKCKLTKIINLPKILDKRGNLTFIEGKKHIPFEIKRAYWIYDVPGGEKRGGHAYKTLREFVIALSGSFDVLLDDGNGKKVYSLNRSYYGIYIPEMVWREINNFSTNALCLVLASDFYKKEEYIMNYKNFKNMTR